ncbi:MAG: T9SS type A sorting domain-containing protein [Chitinophagales bacterium]|nr:T9SS type A sorting domain-containing protein [Chitinophagales bacterium]
MKNLLISVLSLLCANVFAQNTFTTIYNTLQSKCASCHSGGSPAGGLNLSGTETQVYNAIVEVAPTNATAAAKGEKLIDKGYPERSFLLRKVAHGLSDDLALTTGEGNAEPNGQTKLADQDIELIRQWIIMAAPQTGNVVNYQTLVDYYTVGGRPKIARPAAPPAGQGYQIHFGPIFWEGGEETEYFKKFDPNFTQNMEVSKFELYMNSESHHFILRKFHPNTEQNYSDGLLPFTVSAFSDDKDFINAWQISTDLELPIGTGFFWDQNTVLDLNFHMKNYHANEILPGEFYFNVWTKPRSGTTVEMQAELIPYPAIFIQNNNQPVTFSDNVTRGSQTWNIWMLSSHTHKYGIDYDIFQRNSNGSQGTKLYEGFYDFDYTFNQGFYDWSHPPVKRFSPMIPVNMSNGLIHKATYKNNGSNLVTWGFTTDGEMMLIYVQYTTQSVAYEPPVSVSGNNPCNPVQLSTDGGLSAYLWSNGETTQTVNISTPGTYSVTVTDGSGNTYTSDPVSVNVNPASVDLDDAAACQGDNVTLDAGSSATSYEWSTGATSQTINATASGSYAVTVTNADGCTATDFANITVNQMPVVNISDVSICTGSSATFDAGNAGASYLWTTGETTQSITVSQQGNYGVTVTNNGCASSDAASLTTGTNLVFDLQDKNLCDGADVILDAGFPGSSYLWSNGETTQAITVTTGGAFSVTVTDQTGCDGSDNATVTVVQNPVADAGDDKMLCPGGTVDLTATGGTSYTWSSGQVGSTITVSAEGSYNVTVTDGNGCFATDKTDVEESLILTGSISGSADVLEYSAVPYSVNDNSGSTYQWTVSNGTIASGQGNVSVEITWGTTGTGTLEVIETNADGCDGAKVSLNVNVGPTAIGNIFTEEVAVYPNPFTETSRIVFPSEIRNATLTIRDVAGKVVFFNPSVSGTEITIGREGFSSGLYFAEVRGEKIFIGKMIVRD